MRHRQKIMITLGIIGASYAAYRLYDVQQNQLVRVEQQRAREEQATNELIKNQ